MSSGNATVGFRPNAHDRVLLKQLAHRGETNADVLRRALEALARQEWVAAAQAEAEAIVASGENLNDEPEAW
ncbi:hypothetical protein [Nocardia sp. NPDC051570]|uniref:hypothetical protein n=1 Tax=Nocardia sp. NPDC051570 TaxID=3364324 RepID=UPI0037A6E4A9